MATQNPTTAITTEPLTHQSTQTHDFSPAPPHPVSQPVSQNPPTDLETLYPTLSQQTTITLGDRDLPQASAGNQIPPEERARILAARYGTPEPARPKAKGLARLFAAFRHPKTARQGDGSESGTFGRWNVSYGGGYRTSYGGNAREGKGGVYGGLM